MAVRLPGALDARTELYFCGTDAILWTEYTHDSVQVQCVRVCAQNNNANTANHTTGEAAPLESTPAVATLLLAYNSRTAVKALHLHARTLVVLDITGTLSTFNVNPDGSSGK